MVLLKSREQVADELARLQRDNESLQGKHRLHLELQQQEDFQMPETLQVREDGAASSDSTIGVFSESFGNVFCLYKLVVVIKIDHFSHWLSLLGPTSASPTFSPVAFGLLWILALLCKSGCGGGVTAEQTIHS